MYLGDFVKGATVRFAWNSAGANGASITRATNGTISIYRDGGTTQFTTGVTDTEDFDSLTGVHLVAIDTSGADYVVGSDYAVVLSAATIDGQTVNAVLAHFSINRNASGVTRQGTAQAGAAGTITLDASASATDDLYNGQLVVLIGGTGAGQARFVSDYVSSTKVVTVDANWATNPDATSVFALLPGSPGTPNVNASSLSDNAITAAKIATGAITAAKFAAGAIDAAAIADNAIDAGAIASGAITSAKFAAGAINAAAGELPDPTAEELVNHYSEHLDRYRSEPAASFEQVYFAGPIVDPAATLAALQAGASVAGEPFPQGERFPRYGRSMLRGLFGQAFVDALWTAPVGPWTGPIRSMHGWHYVRVTERLAPVLLPFETVREQVATDFVAAAIQDAVDRRVAELEKSYEVRVERNSSTGAER
jgi:peptidyl-prolyl cis-trans isomerase C